MSRYIVSRSDVHNPGQREYYTLCSTGHYWASDPRSASAWDTAAVPTAIAKRHQARVDNCRDMPGMDWPCDFCGAPIETSQAYCSKECAGMDHRE